MFRAGQPGSRHVAPYFWIGVPCWTCRFRDPERFALLAGRQEIIDFSSRSCRLGIRCRGWRGGKEPGGSQAASMRKNQSGLHPDWLNKYPVF